VVQRLLCVAHMARRTVSDATVAEGSLPDAAQVAQLQTELDRLQREVDEHLRLNAILNDAAEQFVGTLAHDLKNPLAAIKVNIQGLKRVIDRGADMDPAHWVERLARVEVAVEQTLECIAAARARLNSSTMFNEALQRETVDLAALTRAIVDQYRQLAGEHRIRLEFRGRALVGMWDRERLRGAIQAVLENALKFSAEDSLVTVAIERHRQDGQAIMRCKDSGIGIPSRDVAHVCDRFYRGENVVGRYRGAGLGLFEARAAVVAHGGSLSIESAEGRGSTISMSLPLS
jgi:signal transduction histidine kinase